LVARRHVVEPFELPAVELEQFWQEAMTIGRALHALFAPPKINLRDPWQLDAPSPHAYLSAVG
jgi:diadenosine tetraphosphate (Ap4A) HIT family hydrolase